MRPAPHRPGWSCWDDSCCCHMHKKHLLQQVVSCHRVLESFASARLPRPTRPSELCLWAEALHAFRKAEASGDRLFTEQKHGRREKASQRRERKGGGEWWEARSLGHETKDGHVRRDASDARANPSQSIVPWPFVVCHQLFRSRYTEPPVSIGLRLYMTVVTWCLWHMVLYIGLNTQRDKKCLSRTRPRVQRPSQ